ncbi:MAG: hypothetical protein HY431_02830 [Candidatus Levybacteria bacterium]|nr:hypothetical protein [Candidatus Levybacteria bacterium]
MEIALLPKNGLKMKGKNATILVDASDKTIVHSAVILLNENTEAKRTETVFIQGPGEYEVGGIKIGGYRNNTFVAYSITVDTIDILLGTAEALENMQQKLKEHHILIVSTNSLIDSSFVTSLASNAVLFYGEKGSEVIKGFASEAVKKLAKYQVTKDKLPQEMETILLA